MANKVRDAKVKLTGLVYVAESEKAIGIIQEKDVEGCLDPKSAVNVKDLRDKTRDITIWIPKSQADNIDMGKSDIFPNLNVKYPSKFNQEAYPFKQSIIMEVPLWLAVDKGMTYSVNGEVVDPSAEKADKEDAETEEQPSSGW